MIDMRKRVLLFLWMLVFTTMAYATHNRAGEITYQYISPNRYKITVTTYTKESSIAADRCELTVEFGDGKSAVFQRINGAAITDCAHGGVSLGNDIKKNVYEGIHEYPGPGVYTISMADPNRNEAICNIPSSVNTAFFLKTELIINDFLGENNSPVLLNPPIDEACVGECFEHNPAAYDSDGDSLSYSLVNCYADGTPIVGYSLPPNMSYNSIDALRGDLLWCVPTMVCEYNIAILIKEYRRLPGSSERYFIGSVLRDMQINVKNCANDKPVIANINDTCVVAGGNVIFHVKATDPNSNNILTLSATGGPFQENPPANFFSNPSFSPATGTFSWNPNCAQLKLLPYSVTFKVKDSNPNPLVDFKTVFIRVVAPAPTSIMATPFGASIVLDWNDALCNNTLGDNPLVGYWVYRKNSCDTWQHSPCETGIPSYTGYTKIASTLPGVTTFTDNNNGLGLTNGVDYSYRIVAVYNDGSQSYSTVGVCAKLIRDVPIITKVSVMSTGTNDSMWVHWESPLGDAQNLDTIANPPVYQVKLFKARGLNPAANSFTEVASYTYNAFWKITDTGFVVKNLNTRDSAYTFRVDFISNGSFVGSTNTASSVYLSASPVAAGKAITLSWQYKVPWENEEYYIYKETFPGSQVYALYDSTNAMSYTDTALLNGVSYCYKVVSKGQFSDPSLERPLYNNSEIKCESPVDRTPPCQPDIAGIASDCEKASATITWLNPNTYCSDDALSYNIYFAPTENDVPLLIDHVSNLSTTTYTYYYLYEGKIPSAAGCYFVSAIDSSGNESSILKKQCTDNCPIYTLPNVFTPNGDGENDLFKPLLPYRYIKNVDMKIYNRWGTKLFETTDTEVLWDGKNMSNKKLCPEGVYYYICTVYEIRVTGIVPHVLKGFIHLMY